MKIAICYWGMTRSTKFVYESHITNLYEVLKNNNIEYNTFMHTWETKNNANIIWENICDINIDYEEYKFLNPDFYKIEKQWKFLETLDFNNYFNKELYDKYGGDTPHEWRPRLIMNHLCALESQKRVYNMVKETNINYDFIIYIRPDVKILNLFDLNYLKMQFDIIIPENSSSK